MMEPIVAGFQSCWADGFSNFFGSEILSWLENRNAGFGFNFLPFIGGWL